MTAILVVEDEPIIREVTAALLHHCGFVLHTAACPDDALSVIRRFPIDILLTDVCLQGRHDGFAMAEQLRRIGWGGHIIFTSGDPDAISAARGVGERTPLLPKPYGRQTLLSAIRQLGSELTEGA